MSVWQGHFRGKLVVCNAFLVLVPSIFLWSFRRYDYLIFEIILYFFRRFNCVCLCVCGCGGGGVLKADCFKVF